MTEARSTCPNRIYPKDQTMRAAVMYSPGDIRLEDVPKPSAASGEVLLRVAAVGVCGSDIPRMLT
jgi:L-iditol 2-dehydrogenase